MYWAAGHPPGPQRAGAALTDTFRECFRSLCASSKAKRPVLASGGVMGGRKAFQAEETVYTDAWRPVRAAKVWL